MTDQPSSPDVQTETVEIDASKFLDVIHKYPLERPIQPIHIPKESIVLKAQADGLTGTICVYVKRPIDDPEDESGWADVMIWCVNTGQPMSRFNMAYIGTANIVRPPTIVTPSAKPEVIVWHCFVDVQTALDGECGIAGL